MLVGYVRVSSLDQNPERQLEELKAMQVEKIFMDKLSGKNVERPELQNMLNFVREGDTLVVHSLDRLARNLSDLLTMVQDLTGRGVSVRFLNERLDFDAGKEASPVAKLMLSMKPATQPTIESTSRMTPRMMPTTVERTSRAQMIQSISVILKKAAELMKPLL